MAIWHMRIACCIPKATDTHSEYVLPIVFPLQQWLDASDSILRYMYIDCLSCFVLLDAFQWINKHNICLGKSSCLKRALKMAINYHQQN